MARRSRKLISFSRRVDPAEAAVPRKAERARCGHWRIGLRCPDFMESQSLSATVIRMRGWVGGEGTRIESYPDPANYMDATVVSYSGTELVLNVTAVAGSGTFSVWKVLLTTVVYNTGTAFELGSSSSDYLVAQGTTAGDPCRRSSVATPRGTPT